MNILCIDDTPDILHVLRWVLTDEGFEVDTAASGPEALRKIRVRTPDLVVTDYKMPGMSGVEVCQQLKGNPLTRHVPVVLHSAHAVSGGACGFDRTFTKPADLEVMLSAIKILLHLEN